MKLEEVLPALRQGAQLRLNGVTFYLTDEGLRVFANDVGTVESSSLTAFTAKEINSNEFEIVLPQRVGGDTDSREPSTADRPVPGFGGYVLDIQDHDVFTSEGRSFLDNLGGPEIAQIDGRWLYVDPSLPKVNG